VNDHSTRGRVTAVDLLFQAARHFRHGRRLSRGCVRRDTDAGESDRYTAESQATPLADGSFIFAARGNGLGQWWRRGHSHLDESELWQKTGDTYTKLTDRGAKQQWPMATADGSRVFFMSDRTGAQNIWSMPRGGQAKQVTNFTDGRVVWPSLSYDGQEIVFERNFRIWKMKADGGAREVPITLRGVASSPMNERVSAGTQLRELALSPDGKKIAVIARGEVFAASAKDGGDAVRVTTTAAPESFVTWTTDSKKLVYTSERDGAMNLYQYDFGTEAETPLTRGADQDTSPVFSPDGKTLAFIRNSRSLMALDMDSKQVRELSKIYADTVPILGPDTVKWSPDGKWVAFLTVAPETRSYTNVSVVPAAGGAARPISFLANSFANALAWSPDGSFILFDTGQRTEDGSIARIDLKLRTPRFREDQFRDLFKQENPRERPTQPGTSPAPAASPSPAASPAPEKKEDKATEIVFDDIRKRLSFLNTGVNNSGTVISPDGKTLLILASAEGQFNLYTMPLDELATDQSARQLTSTQGFKSQAQFTPDNKEIYYLENGRVQIVTLERREVRPLNLNIDINVNFAEEKMEVFKQGWRYMRDNFYDDKYHGVNWDGIRGTYEPMVASAKTMDEVRRP
jgi:Tol biopolymer transport system component